MRFVACLMALLFAPATVRAGMPSARISDVANLRVESISFFLVVFFLCALAVQLLWNTLRRDFVSLPRLGYWRSVGVVIVWGALFVIVLTMISGARELLTPGAWEKVGLTYQLKSPVAATPAPDVRRARMEGLRTALWGYASSHEGRLPASSTDPGIAAEIWQAPASVPVSYGYIPGRRVNAGKELIAFEPTVYSGVRLALFADGQIKSLNDGEIDGLIAEGPHHE